MVFKRVREQTRVRGESTTACDMAGGREDGVIDDWVDTFGTVLCKDESMKCEVRERKEKDRQVIGALKRVTRSTRLKKLHMEKNNATRKLEDYSADPPLYSFYRCFDAHLFYKSD